MFWKKSLERILKVDISAFFRLLMKSLISVEDILKLLAIWRNHGQNWLIVLPYSRKGWFLKLLVELNLVLSLWLCRNMCGLPEWQSLWFLVLAWAGIQKMPAMRRKCEPSLCQITWWAREVLCSIRSTWNREQAWTSNVNIEVVIGKPCYKSRRALMAIVQVATPPRQS